MLIIHDIPLANDAGKLSSDIIDIS